MESETYKYRAFISYSHNDKQFAKWLHKKIENYKIPNSLRDKYPHLPKDLKRTVFIDEEELPIAASLPRNLSEALEISELLIVVCSPSAASSHWVGKEAEYFKHYHGEDRVLAVLKEGEPNATYSSIYDDSLEAFPKALRYSVDQHGELTDERTEPLAADARTHKEKKKALLKLIAGILKVDFADLWEREKREARKRAIIASMVVVTFLALGIYASTQFLGEQQNKELEHIKDRIAFIEYSIRNDDLSQEKVIALNVELKKLKKDKENKEATLEVLGELKTSIGKEADDIYRREGAEAAIALLTSKETSSDQESRLKEISREKVALAKLYVETYEFEKAKESFQEAINLFFDYENGMEYQHFLNTNNHLLEAIEVLEKLKKMNLMEDQMGIVFAKLGAGYSETSKFKKAEKALLEALKLFRISPKYDSRDYSLIIQEARLYLKLLYLRTNRIKEAEEVLIEIEKLHPDLVPIYTVINNLLSKTKVSERTEQEYIKKIAQLRQLAKKEPDTYNPILGQTLLFLVMLYDQTNRLNEKEAVNLEAIKLYRSLSKTNPDAYNRYLVSVLKELADLYSETNKFKKAEEIYIETINLYRILFKINPSIYSLDFAVALESLGLLHIQTNSLKKAEELYLDAIKIKKTLAKKDPIVYSPGLSSTLTTLGIIYQNANKIKEAEEIYLEAIKIKKALAKNNPDAYNSDLAKTLILLGQFYTIQNKPEKAEEPYLEALKIQRVLAKNNPDVYNSYSAEMLSEFASLYHNSHKFKEAEKLYLEILKTQKTLAKNDSDAHSRDLGVTLSRLASLYRDYNKLKKSEEHYLEALKIQRSLAKNNSYQYNCDLAMTLQEFAFLYERTNRLEKAEELFLKTLKIRRSLTNEKYNDDLIFEAATLYHLARLYGATSRPKEAEELYFDALKIIRSFVSKTPSSYNQYLSMVLNEMASFYRDLNRTEDAMKIEKELSEM